MIYVCIHCIFEFPQIFFAAWKWNEKEIGKEKLKLRIEEQDYLILGISFHFRFLF